MLAHTHSAKRLEPLTDTKLELAVTFVIETVIGSNDSNR
jgi:hypothetical protein